RSPTRDLNKFSGDFVDRVTPVPIPNTEVKPVGADGTARETAWESRKSPGLIKTKSPLKSSGLFVFCHITDTWLCTKTIMPTLQYRERSATVAHSTNQPSE